MVHWCEGCKDFLENLLVCERDGRSVEDLSFCTSKNREDEDFDDLTLLTEYDNMLLSESIEDND